MIGKRTRLPSTATLTAFESAARHLNFRRAGEELHLTQGAVSQHVRQLEDLLGVTLFVRVHRRVLLTRAGERYLSTVRRILGELGEATHQAIASGDKDILNLAVVPAFAIKWLVPRLASFFAQHPDVNLNLVSRRAPFDFSTEPFDAAIHYGEASWPEAVCTHLMDENMLPVCSVSYQDRLGLYRPEDLARAALLQQFTRPSAWQDWFSQVGIAPANAFQGQRFDSFLMTLEATQAHLGAALLPHFLVADGLAQGRLVQLSPQTLLSTRGYYLVCPRAKYDVRAITLLRAWLLAQIQNTAMQNTPIDTSID